MTIPRPYDVVVIGAGIVGSAIARELAGYQLSVALLAARDDVCEGTHKANTAILHTGYDAKPGTLESAMVRRGYHLLSEYAKHTGIPIEHTGAILVAWDAEQLDALPSLKKAGIGCGDFLVEQAWHESSAFVEEELESGLRGGGGDYLIEVDPHQHYLLVGGIRSTGLTSGIAIAEYVRDKLESGLQLTPKPEVPAPPRMPNIGEAFTRPYQDAERISADPAHGRIVCFCERVTQGEIRDACHSAIPPAALEGLRRRTRVMNGRCQAFFCGAEVQTMFENEIRHATQPTPIKPGAVTKPQESHR